MDDTQARLDVELDLFNGIRGCARQRRTTVLGRRVTVRDREPTGVLLVGRKEEALGALRKERLRQGWSST